MIGRGNKSSNGFARNSPMGTREFGRTRWSPSGTLTRRRRATFCNRCCGIPTIAWPGTPFSGCISYGDSAGDPGIVEEVRRCLPDVPRHLRLGDGGDRRSPVQRSSGRYAEGPRESSAQACLLGHGEAESGVRFTGTGALFPLSARFLVNGGAQTGRRLALAIGCAASPCRLASCRLTLSPPKTESRSPLIRLRKECRRTICLWPFYCRGVPPVPASVERDRLECPLLEAPRGCLGLRILLAGRRSPGRFSESEGIEFLIATEAISTQLPHASERRGMHRHLAFPLERPQSR